MMSSILLIHDSVIQNASATLLVHDTFPYTDVSCLCIGSNRGDIHVEYSESADTNVSYAVADGIIIQKHGNILEITSEKMESPKRGAKVDFYITTGMTLKNINVELGSGNVFVKNKMDGSLKIEGGGIDVFGTNLFCPMEFEFGGGTVNLFYDTVELPNPVVCKCNAGSLTAKVFLSKAFKTASNLIEGGLVECYSHLPTSEAGETADFTSSGAVGSAKITIQPYSMYVINKRNAGRLEVTQSTK
ncbi:hypothetical protein FACS189449_04530 [Alphaproteobacteria bacterium]|nr:hypothetical protein FACS189449_04530 [Alphaproteobacteria bacterium]